MTVGEQKATPWQDFDSTIESYEVAWGSGSIPAFSDFLPNASHPQYFQMLVELARVDIELRWKNSHPLTLEDYFTLFPALKDDRDALAQLAFEEYRARRSAGQTPSVADYAARYQIATSKWTNSKACGESFEAERDRSSLANKEATKPVPASSRSGLPAADIHVPGFQILGELGRGAFSQVYLARQTDLAKRLVVLKVSTESFAEAEKMAQLQHAHVVPIYSVHRAGSSFAACMPFFGVTTVADLIRKLNHSEKLPTTGAIVADTVYGNAASTRIASIPPHSLNRATKTGQPISPADADLSDLQNRDDSQDFLKPFGTISYVEAVLRIGEHLADGLRHAHERGIIHRDLKPANVLLADDGRPMLLDFNLSEDLKPNGERVGTIVGGTLPYMSPEQLVAFQERRSALDSRSDLYSLGVILYELLSRRQPFPVRSGNLEEMLTKMREDRLRPPSGLQKLNPAVSPAVEAIVTRCLEPDPNQRYQRAEHLVEDLQRQVQHLPLKHASEPSVRERLRKWTLRHPRLTAVATLFFIVFGVTYSAVAYQERTRIAKSRLEVQDLMQAGQDAMNQGDAAVAQGRFRSAWMKVQSEPALIEFQPGVSGWLDHSRRAVIQQQWRQRIPPHEFEHRRDEAILLSLLLDPVPDNSVTSARDAIHAALSLTTPGDPGWQHEREQLLHVEADLIAATSSPEQALAFFDQSDEFSSRSFLVHRAELLEKLGRTNDATDLRKRALQIPPDEISDRFLEGINRLRRRDFELARRDFEQIQDSRPENFLSRLFHGICLLNLNRPSEAKLALSPCIAQHPYFLWSYYFRGQANLALDERSSAALDFQRVLELGPPSQIRKWVDTQLKLIDKKVMSSVSMRRRAQPVD